MAHPHGLKDGEAAALRALQNGTPAPPVDAAVWKYLVSASYVWIDRLEEPAVVQLTPIGRSYPAD